MQQISDSIVIVPIIIVEKERIIIIIRIRFLYFSCDYHPKLKISLPLSLPFDLILSIYLRSSLSLLFSLSLSLSYLLFTGNKGHLKVKSLSLFLSHSQSGNTLDYSKDSSALFPSKMFSSVKLFLFVSLRQENTFKHICL